MNKLVSTSEAIVFDLGEVIVDLDPNAVIKAFQKHATHLSKDQILELIVSDDELYQYEIGALTTQNFIGSVNAKFEIELSLEEFSEIWNSMLSGIDEAKVDLLKRLGTEKKTMFLSNTNAMHEQGFDRIAKEKFGLNTLGELVEKPLYSHDVGLRKPDQAIYEFLISEAGVPAEKIIFFDDKIENIASAKDLGIHAIHLENRYKLLSYFE